MMGFGATIIETVSSLFVNLAACCKNGSQIFRGIDLCILALLHNGWFMVDF